MVAIIKTGHSIRRIVNYNENKIKEGVAHLIAAVNYPIDTDKLSFNHKLNRLLNQASLNTNVSRNSVHVSLNFDPSENHSAEKLEEIANTYMDRIGFGNQPYLVYQHFDAAHPHIHIVSIKVRGDGIRIDTHNIGRNQSEKARKEIETEFGLVKAGKHSEAEGYKLQPLTNIKANYGKSVTKRAMANVLGEVLYNYKYTSIPELNAVLRQFNLMADRGSENSRIYKSNGLVYRLLDSDGNKVGVPVKASDFHDKPTLNFLNERFGINERERQPHKVRVKNVIDLLLIRNPAIDLGSLIKGLEKESIQTVLRQNAEGLIYGITYIDHRTKSVFNGSALGKQYSANGLQERLRMQPKSVTAKRAGEEKSLAKGQPLFLPAGVPKASAGSNLPEIIMNPKEDTGNVPGQLKKTKRKKRKVISK